MVRLIIHTEHCPFCDRDFSAATKKQLFLQMHAHLITIHNHAFGDATKALHAIGVKG